MPNKERHLFYIGGYLDEETAKERRIPARNAAGSNRMLRVSNALVCGGYLPTIISPGVTFRSGGFYCLNFKENIKFTSGVRIIFCPSLGIKYFSALFAWAMIIRTIRSCNMHGEREKSPLAITYNYNPTLAIVALYLKYFLGFTIIHNIEELTRPQMPDFLASKIIGTGVAKDFLYSFCCKLITSLSSKIITPATRFLTSKSQVLRAEVVTGCFDGQYLAEVDREATQGILNILLSGKISNEHGASLLFDTLDLLDPKVGHGTIVVNICGHGDQLQAVVSRSKGLRNIEVVVHGFISDESYRSLLRTSNICLALQSPLDRFANTHTPSKTYEFLGSGKTVIASNVGDLHLLPRQVIFICDPYSADKLADLIRNLLENPDLIQEYSKSAKIYAAEHFSYESVGAKLRTLIG